MSFRGFHGPESIKIRYENDYESSIGQNGPESEEIRQECGQDQRPKWVRIMKSERKMSRRGSETQMDQSVEIGKESDQESLRGQNGPEAVKP